MRVPTQASCSKQFLTVGICFDQKGGVGAVGCFAYLGLFYQQQMLPSGSVQHKCAWNGHNCKLFIFCYLHILMGKLTLILKEEVFSTTSTPCGYNAVYLLHLR